MFVGFSTNRTDNVDTSIDLDSTNPLIIQANTFSVGTAVYLDTDGIHKGARADQLTTLGYYVVLEATPTAFRLANPGNLLTVPGLTANAFYHVSVGTAGLLEPLPVLSDTLAGAVAQNILGQAVGINALRVLSLMPQQNT